MVGSLAVREPARVARWLGRFGAERLTIALDVREVDGEWRLPVAGWTADSGARLDELLACYADAGLRHLLCTDIACDGMLAGPNLGLYRRVLARAPAVAVQGSGGVRDVADVRALRDAGCAGAVLGRALLEGRLRLDDALREAA